MTDYAAIRRISEEFNNEIRRRIAKGDADAIHSLKLSCKGWTSGDQAKLFRNKGARKHAAIIELLEKNAQEMKTAFGA